MEDNEHFAPLPQFEKLMVGQSEWLTDSLAKMGITQLKHLKDDRRTIVERWGEPSIELGLSRTR